MNTAIITQALTALAIKRPFFWSEADFQFAFSEALRTYLPNAKIRLERPFPITNKKYYHVDIWVEDKGKIHPIELKYKTKKCCTTIANETIRVTDQSATDLGRYDYIADIKRIEDILHLGLKSFGEGYAIMLTNDANYYDPMKQNHKPTMDSDFRIYDGAILKKVLRWNNNPNSKTVNANGDRGSRKAINLSTNYNMHWTIYSNILDNSGKVVVVKSCVTVIKK